MSLGTLLRCERCRVIGASAMGYMLDHGGMMSAMALSMGCMLLTAILTLLSGAILQLLQLNRPMVDLTGWPSFAAAPIREAFDIAILRRQPYLSSVLPMYVIFAIPVPLQLKVPSTAVLVNADGST